MTDKRQQQESRMRADLSKRLQEKLQSQQEFIGKIIRPAEPKQPESRSEEC